MVEVEKLIKNCKQKEIADYLVKNSNLPGRMANLRLAGEAQKIFKEVVYEVEFQRLFDLAIFLEKHDHEYVRMVAGRAFGALGKDHHTKVLPHLKVLADDNSWRVREGAAEGIGELLCFHFEPVYKKLQAWIKSGMPNLQRAVAVGMISMMSYDETRMKEKTSEILASLENLLRVDEEYVFKNTGFALNILGWKSPKKVLYQIKRWVKDKRFNSSATTLRIFVNSLDSRFGKQNAKEAMSLLDEIENRHSEISDPKKVRQLSTAIGKVRKILSKK